MCFRFRLSNRVLDQLEKKYQGIEDVIRNIKIPDDPDKDWVIDYNGFAHPDTIVVANDQPDRLQLMNWGLIPKWKEDRSIQRYTLNARIEDIKETPSYKRYVDNRCLIFADGFYEWQWLDEEGKNKQKHVLTLPNDEMFAFAGLWNAWKDPNTGSTMKTYTILTTEANELMSRIHNSKKRMPVIVKNQDKWLVGENLILQNDMLLSFAV